MRAFCTSTRASACGGGLGEARRPRRRSVRARTWRSRTPGAAVSPAKASVIWSSSLTTLRMVRASWSLATAFRSTPSATQLFPVTPTVAAPFFTASNA